ncbi:hypothetical protein ACFW6Y_29375, partial [Streptomyces microflavus]
QHVFASQLHHERHHPRLARRHNLLKVPLADPTITVPGVQAVHLVAAFPTRPAGDVKSVLAVMLEARIAPTMPFEVEVQGETVAIQLHAGD